MITKQYNCQDKIYIVTERVIERETERLRERKRGRKGGKERVENGRRQRKEEIDKTNY